VLAALLASALAAWINACSSSICDWATFALNVEKRAFCYQTLVLIRKPNNQISVVSLKFFLHGKHNLKKISF
jgi:hypothetical protein